MKYFIAVALCLTLTSTAICQNKITKNCKPCASFKTLDLPDVFIKKTESFLNDTIKANQFQPEIVISKPFCRLEGIIGKEIAFELYLPQNWNGRFLMSGNGGFAGAFQNFLLPYISGGYAVAATNTGHVDNNDGAAWAYNDIERQVNFGHLAVHRTTVVSKALIRAAYCTSPSYSYFLGCSRGGGQALMEAQRYPDDYDGIVAGAPAYNWPAIAAKGILSLQKNYPDAKKLNPVITDDNLKLLQDIVCKECDLADGLGDCILNEPNNCKTDLSKLPLCPGDTAGKDCFTNAQVAALRAIFEPLILEGKLVHPGFPHGIEAEPTGIDLWIAGTSPFVKPSLWYYFATNIYKYLIYNDPSWDYQAYRFDDFFTKTAFASSFLDATNADYSAFEKSKGRLILYHGWNDPALSAYATIAHYEEALKKNPNLQSFMRLFLLPGVLHCEGGPGADDVDYVKLISDWVEKGNAPERVVFSKKEKGKTVMTRPVYPYPKVAVYDGKGDPKLESSFGVKK